MVERRRRQGIKVGLKENEDKQEEQKQSLKLALILMGQK